jgi:DNA topoisomerase-6 subunit B
MTSFQSTLADEEEGIAEELAASQREISVAEFFEKNKHMLGFDSGARGLVTAVKEAVDNALDATEEAGILPDIYVEISEGRDYYTLVVEDNGPGITKAQIPKIFGKLLYGSRFHAREQSLTPDQRVMIRRDGDVEFVPIGVLCDAFLPENGAGTTSVPSDIEAPCFDRETKSLSWEPVTHAIRHKTDERTYEITAEKGRTVEVTGNHSLFSVDEHGETTEVEAATLEAGDAVLAPQSLPTPKDTVSEVNLLNYLDEESVQDRRIYVYGFDKATLAELKTGEKIRRQPSTDSTRKRTYYRYEGVEISKDSLEQNYLKKGYLPAETVLELGWEDRAADCQFKTYQVGGDETTIPVSLPLDDELAKLVGYYVSEGHVDDRQVGFTFGSHETGLVSATERAVAAVGGETTTVERDQNSTRVKAFASPLRLFLESACGSSAAEKRVPAFAFDAPQSFQQRLVAAIYEGDGSDSHPSNELSHTTTSETLARQLSVLWNMQGVLASSETNPNGTGYTDDPCTVYRTKVYGEDAAIADVFETDRPTGQQQYKRIPVSLLDPVRADDSKYETVPDTIPGLLAAAGVGSSLDHAEQYQSLIEDAVTGECVGRPRYAHNLKEKGLLDDENQATTALHELWSAIQDLHGITDSDMCLLTVQSVKQTDAPEYVYDISVPGASGSDENFVVANDGALSVKNSRGQQGIGISAAVLYSQLTSGKPVRIESRTQESATSNFYELIIDTDTNEPEISTEKELSAAESDLRGTHGTRIEMDLDANMRARGQLHDYIKHTAVVNPHARIELQEPGGEIKAERAEGAGLPAETDEIRPHPHGVELGTLIKMLSDTDSHSVSGFLQGEFTRVGKKTADSIVDAFRDRYFGREMRWRPPGIDSDTDLEATVVGAVSNKDATHTKVFAQAVVDAVEDAEHVAYSELEALVADAAADAEADTGTSFGDTVQGNVVDAVWAALTENRAADVFVPVDEATTVQKDDATVRGLAERVAAKFESGPGKDRVTRDDLEEYVHRAAENTEEYEDATVGETARENVADALWERMATVPDEPPLTRELADDRDAASDLLDAMASVSVMAPPTSCLSPIEADQLEAGLRKEFDAEFYAASTRDADVHGGDPFIVEAGIAYGGELEAEGGVDLMRFANRVPLVYQRGACATTDVLRNIGWRNYNLDQPGGSGLPQGPAVIMVHVASTNVPFTSESKDAVAHVEEIEDEIELAVREAARDLKSFLNKRQSMRKRQQKQDVIMDILPTMAEKVSEMTDRGEVDVDDSLARIMNNVLVERELGDDGTVTLRVENHGSSSADVDVTDIVSAPPAAVSDGANVVEMDGEHFVKWSPSVAGGETEELTYEVDSDADFELTVQGVEDARLTVNEADT